LVRTGGKWAFLVENERERERERERKEEREGGRSLIFLPFWTLFLKAFMRNMDRARVPSVCIRLSEKVDLDEGRDTRKVQ